MGWRGESYRHYLASKGIKTSTVIKKKYQEEFPLLVKPFTGQNPRITKGYARFRQEDPKKFDESTFRTKDETKNLKIVVGKEKKSGKFKVQSVLVSRKNYWSKMKNGEKEALPRVMKNPKRWEDLDDIVGYEAFVGEDENNSTKAMDLDKYEKRADGKYHLKKEYYAMKEEELWEERKSLVKERNDVLAKMRREPSVALRNELHDVEERLRENGKQVGVEPEKEYYSKRILMKKGKTHVTRSGEEVKKHAEEVRKKIASLAKEAVIAGSIRRGVEDPVDVDIVVVPKREQDIGKIKDIVKKGATKIYADGQYKVATRLHGIKTEVIFAKPSEFGAELLTATGSAGHNIGFRKIAKEKGMLLNQTGLYRNGKRVAVSERGIYKALGHKYKRPEERM